MNYFKSTDRNIKKTDIRLVPEKKQGEFPPMIFGVNAEITRKAFFGGLSAEMLNNRKFLMGDEAPRGWECTNCEFIKDEKHRSLCGSNFAVLHNGRMSQTSEVISLRKDEKYKASAWVKACDEKVNITFGVSRSEQTFTVEADPKPYRELNFTFDGTDIDNGTFTVTADGNIEIFEVSLIPTDNFYGMRWDVIELLKEIAPTSVRFPGGCAADHFAWKESLKQREFRTPMDGTCKSWFLFRNTYDQDPFDIGINEFIMLCRELNAEPEFTISILLSDGEDARQLVEYCNGSPETEYGAKRQALGFDAFNIPLWYIGNEVSGFGNEFGFDYASDPKKAAQRTNEIVKAIKEVDSSISVVVSTTWADWQRDWSNGFIENLDCPHEYISYHEYTDHLMGGVQSIPDEQTCKKLEDLFMNGEAVNLDYFKNGLKPGYFDDKKVCADEWNYSWGRDSNNVMFFSNALQLHLLAKSREKYHIERAQFFLPVNEGMITVHGSRTNIESSGLLFRYMHLHKGGNIINCICDNPDLDILCTEHTDGSYFMSVINRRSEPVHISIEDHDIFDLIQIKTGEFSFDCNDYEIVSPDEPIVYGHSALFITMATLQF